MLFYLAALIGVLVGVVIVLLVLAPKVDWSSRAESQPPPLLPAYDPNQGAIEQIEEGRRKRAEARELAQRDPHMAHELRIGRPDLPRQYDDGGLIDVNSVPEESLSKYLGLSAAKATHVVEVRQQLGGFEHGDDLVNLAGVELSVYELVKDRIILL